MPELDTTQVETAVTAPSESTATPQATGSGTQEPAKEQTPLAPAAGEVDVNKLTKELEQARMEANLHKNKVKEYESAQETARKAELTEVERLTEELAERDSRDSLREAQNLRTTTIDEYLKDDPTTLKAAKALIERNPLNLGWGEGLTADEAKAELIGQLDALKEVVGGTPAEPTDNKEVHANNPVSRVQPDPERAELIKKARETGDFSSLLRDIPSVAAQIARIKE